MDIVVELKGVDEAFAILNRVAVDAAQANLRALRSIAILVQREARRNAPRSPTRGQLNRRRKTRRKVTRKDRATSRPSPGGLERSIDRESTHETASVYVASNSFAGKYATKIHDEKGSSWNNRGPGTRAKGSRADDRFIIRAILDNEGQIMEIIKAEHKKAGWYEL